MFSKASKKKFIDRTNCELASIGEGKITGTIEEYLAETEDQAADFSGSMTGISLFLSFLSISIALFVTKDLPLGIFFYTTYAVITLSLVALSAILLNYKKHTPRRIAIAIHQYRLSIQPVVCQAPATKEIPQCEAEQTTDDAPQGSRFGLGAKILMSGYIAGSFRNRR